MSQPGLGEPEKPLSDCQDQTEPSFKYVLKRLCGG